MSFRLVAALSVFVLLVGAASWMRFSTIDYIQPNLVTIENLDIYGLSDKDFVNDFLKPKAEGASYESEPLSNTDIITRKLLMSYLDTAVSGKGVVNTNTLNTIADHYVDETVNLHTFNSVSIQEISLVQDNETNARNYAKEFSKIYSNYTWEITLLTKNLKNTEALAVAYENMSHSLKALPVPLSVSVLHLQLVNNHASTAAAMRSMKEVEIDPIKTIAGMAAIKENVLKETSALADIDRILREKYNTL